MNDQDLILKPVPHQTAMAFIKNKPAVSRETFNKLLPELRSRAFMISGVPAFDVLQRVRDRIADLPAGGDWDTIKQDISGELSPYLVDDNADPETQDSQMNAANRRAELLLRTHGFQAYQSAQYEVMQRQIDVFPYWQYMTMEDEAVRDEHAALDGLILPANSPFWQDHYPPWDWGCRCQVVPVTPDDVADVKDGNAELGTVLSPRLEQELETAGRIATKNGQVVNVESPSRRGKENAFQWHPGSMRMPERLLKEKYDSEIYSQFVSWMKSIRMNADGVEDTTGSSTLYELAMKRGAS